MNPIEQTRFGDFEIIRVLGRGGMGVVYEALQTSLGRRVALKMLSPGLGTTASIEERFLREARAIARLHHTNIVQIHAAGTQDGISYYAMELVSGPPLNVVISQMRTEATVQGAIATIANDCDATVTQLFSATLTIARREVEETVAQETGAACSRPPTRRSDRVAASGCRYFDHVAQLIAGVADGLDHAHAKGVIHRDIKPANLLLNGDQGCIADFGLARMDDQPGVTEVGELVGSPFYMSPEQCRADPTVDYRTDIYSLGVTLYELLTLQPPFQGERRDLIIRQILNDEPRPPRSVNRAVPVDLQTICLKAMEKDRARRYQSARAMADDLRCFINRFAISAKRVSLFGHLVKFVRRHRAAAAIIAIVLVMASITGIVVYRANQSELRHAKEDALLAAMSGSFEKAEQAIQRAEQLGASSGWIQMSRGQVAFHQGRYQDAIQYLEHAVHLVPSSVAAQAMLAVVWYEDGEYDRYYPKLDELEHLEAVSLEDYLFKGLAQSLALPSRGLPALRKAVAEEPGSAVTHLILARALSEYAMDTGNPQDVETVIEQARTVKSMLGENPVALSVHLIAELVAANVYGETRQTAKQDDALREAEKDVQALSREPFSRLPDVCWALGHYYQLTGEEEKAIEEWRRVTQLPQAPSSVLAYLANALYRRGHSEEAVRILSPLVDRNKDVTVDIALAIVLTDPPNGPARAREAYQIAANRKGSGLVALYPQTILRLLGDKQAAEEACEELRGPYSKMPPWMFEWYKHLLEFNLGSISADDLLSAAGKSRRNQCEAHFFIGVTALSEGDRKNAVKHFRQSVNTGVFLWLDTDYSRSYLAHLENDPTWPPWIPLLESDRE